jgi:hypothetical protein
MGSGSEGASPFRIPHSLYAIAGGQKYTASFTGLIIEKTDLFLRQKRTLDLFLERGTITKAQYDKSLGDLIEKMGMRDYVNTEPF